VTVQAVAHTPLPADPPAATQFYTGDPNDPKDRIGWFDAGQWAFDFDGVADYTTTFGQREQGARHAVRGVHSRDRRLDRRRCQQLGRLHGRLVRPAVRLGQRPPLYLGKTYRDENRARGEASQDVGAAEDWGGDGMDDLGKLRTGIGTWSFTGRVRKGGSMTPSVTGFGVGKTPVVGSRAVIRAAEAE
jgi:hypothetical protein